MNFYCELLQFAFLPEHVTDTHVEKLQALKSFQH